MTDHSDNANKFFNGGSVNSDGTSFTEEDLERVRVKIIKAKDENDDFPGVSGISFRAISPNVLSYDEAKRIDMSVTLEDAEWDNIVLPKPPAFNHTDGIMMLHRANWVPMMAIHGSAVFAHLVEYPDVECFDYIWEFHSYRESTQVIRDTLEMWALEAFKETIDGYHHVVHPIYSSDKYGTCVPRGMLIRVFRNSDFPDQDHKELANSAMFVDVNSADIEKLKYRLHDYQVKANDELLSQVLHGTSTSPDPQKQNIPKTVRIGIVGAGVGLGKALAAHLANASMAHGKNKVIELDSLSQIEHDKDMFGGFRTANELQNHVRKMSRMFDDRPRLNRRSKGDRRRNRADRWGSGS